MMAGKDPFTDEKDREDCLADKLKAITGLVDGWLDENAVKYGYRFTFSKRGKR
jgi:hypothetical protein